MNMYDTFRSHTYQCTQANAAVATASTVTAALLRSYGALEHWTLMRSGYSAYVSLWCGRPTQLVMCNKLFICSWCNRIPSTRVQANRPCRAEPSQAKPHLAFANFISADLWIIRAKAEKTFATILWWCDAAQRPNNSSYVNVYLCVYFIRQWLNKCLRVCAFCDHENTSNHRNANLK